VLADFSGRLVDASCWSLFGATGVCGDFDLQSINQLDRSYSAICVIHLSVSRFPVLADFSGWLVDASCWSLFGATGVCGDCDLQSINQLDRSYSAIYVVYLSGFPIPVLAHFSGRLIDFADIVFCLFLTWDCGRDPAKTRRRPLGELSTRPSFTL